MLLPRALLDALLFLGALRMLVAPLSSMLLAIVLVLPLLLLSMLLLLSVLLLGFGLLVLTLLLLGVILLFALLLVLCISRGSNSEKQRQNGCAGDFNCVHMCYLYSFQDGLRLLAQASSCRVHRLPMASPDTRSSTLRFCCRPAELSLEATAPIHCESGFQLQRSQNQELRTGGRGP